MSPRRHPLTAEARLKLLNGIRSGGYPHVAAQAWGISRATLDVWLERGRQAKAREPYRSFARDHDDACAQARLQAEILLYKDDPKIWLEHGPGRESRDNPGWTAAARPMEHAAAESNPLMQLAVMRLVKAVMDALDAHPECRQDVLTAVERAA